MKAATDTVHGRIEHARTTLSKTQIVIGLALLLALGVALLVAQQPMLHDSLHNFRHTAGITCH